MGAVRFFDQGSGQLCICVLSFFLAASLTFSLQPMVGKMMLPYVGGAPAGWIVAMCFFQVALLCGYTLSWGLSRLNVFTQSIVIILALLAGYISMPIIFSGELLQGGISPARVFGQLIFVCFIPFVALSMIAPSLQRIFSYSDHKTAQDPYYLYAASNIGSFTGLLSYPLLVEPYLALGMQSSVWSAIYTLQLVVFVLACLFVFVRKQNLIKIGTVNLSDKVKAISLRQRLEWIALSAIPSSLILGVTTEITTDIASVPMIWIFPLALYLLTHIFAFGQYRWVSHRNLPYFHLLLVALVVLENMKLGDHMLLNFPFFISLLLYLSCFFMTALLLHVRLVEKRPEVGHLTQFYFFLALGGAIGGAFNAFAAPVIFNAQYEFLGVLILSLLASPLLRWPQGAYDWWRGQTIAFCLAIVASAVLYIGDASFVGDVALRKMLSILMVMAFVVLSIKPVQLFFAALYVFVAVSLILPQFSNDIVQRNFYGISKVVVDHYESDGGSDIAYKRLMHGSTLHGVEYKENKGVGGNLLSYYSIGGPVDHAFALVQPENVMVVGLGVGTIACYKDLYSNTDIAFVEIDRKVEVLAQQEFRSLNECPPKEIIIADGRLHFEKLVAADKKYELIIMDAFSSDVVPVHLLTLEAISLYKKVLAKDGMLLFHISNRYFNLEPVLNRIATEVGLNFHVIAHTPLAAEETPLANKSVWVAMSAEEQYTDKLVGAGWGASQRQAALWTDNYSNLLGTLRILLPFGFVPNAEQSRDKARALYKDILRYRGAHPLDQKNLAIGAGYEE